MAAFNLGVSLFSDEIFVSISDCLFQLWAVLKQDSLCLSKMNNVAFSWEVKISNAICYEMLRIAVKEKHQQKSYINHERKYLLWSRVFCYYVDIFLERVVKKKDAKAWYLWAMFICLRPMERLQSPITLLGDNYCLQRGDIVHPNMATHSIPCTDQFWLYFMDLRVYSCPWKAVIFHIST